MEMSKVFDAFAEGVAQANWECDIDEARGKVTLTKEMPFGEDYEFVILCDSENVEDLMDQLLEGIDEESIEVTSSDFIGLGNEWLSLEDGTAYEYINELTTSLNILGIRVGEAFDILSLEAEFEEADTVA